MAKILVIDDDPVIRQIGKSYFTAKGHSVTIAIDGKDGMDKFKGDAFDIVITDLMMPNMHGYEVIDAIRATRQGASLPILLLTADRKEPGLDKYPRRGFEDDHVAKPFDIPDLEKKINVLLAEGKDRVQ
ncbi:response regulator [bacterium]|nr:response regulator [bacterium]